MKLFIKSKNNENEDQIKNRIKSTINPASENINAIIVKKKDV